MIGRTITVMIFRISISFSVKYVGRTTRARANSMSKRADLDDECLLPQSETGLVMHGLVSGRARQGQMEPLKLVRSLHMSSMVRPTDNTIRTHETCEQGTRCAEPFHDNMTTVAHVSSHQSVMMCSRNQTRKGPPSPSMRSPALSSK